MLVIYDYHLIWLFTRYDNHGTHNDEWWSTSVLSVDLWRRERYAHSEQRRGLSIYLQLQPKWPSYYIQRRLVHHKRDGTRGTGHDRMAMVYDDMIDGVIDHDRGVAFFDSYPSQQQQQQQQAGAGGDHHHSGDRDTIVVRKEGARYLVEESRGGLIRIGTRWLFRYRCGDVPLAAMRAAIFTKHHINDIPMERASISSLCTSNLYVSTISAIN